MKFSKIYISASAVLALAGCGKTSPSENGLSEKIENVRQSTWDTIYSDDDGTIVVEAEVRINGNNGSYVTGDGDQGQLNDLVYAYITPEPTTKVAVYGTYVFGNQSGGITFRIDADGQALNGEWATGNQRGSWNGFRID